MDLAVKLHYAVDFKEIQKATLEAIDSFEQGLKEPAPRIGIDKIDPDGYTILISVWINSHGYQDTRIPGWN